MKKVVSKFGGTSMGDAKCMLRSAEVSHTQSAFVVVVSATSGTTNQLIELSQKAQSSKWDQCEPLIQKIEARHLQIAKDLGAEQQLKVLLQPLFDEMESIAKGVFLLKDCSARALDTLVSLGERMSSVLFTQAMTAVLHQHGLKKHVHWLDVREILCTDDQFGKARPQTDKIAVLAAEKIGHLNPQATVIVTQGFIGRSEEGFTTTLGRGGSDYSAAIVAEAVQADILEIWTDVAGIATTDPRICADARPLEEISFKEASELATFGAKVLHPATLEPAMRKNIPVFVGSSFDAGQKGTWIRREVKSAPLLRALALRKKQVLVTLTTPEMLHSHGFLFKVFKVFNENKVSIDAVTTSEISVSLTLDDATLLNKKLVQELSHFAEVQIEDNLSLVSLIGNNINHTPGLAKKIFETIPEVNVRMICLGASKHNFCFLVKEESGPEVIQRLHKGFGLGIH
jgi:aspartate kinase